ncbi:MAG TPA: hypothetical protein VN522_11695 [Solirubrobacterales bacterium]|nr:hypothetical protein [Solirubrobacterales bacterium]
MNTFIRADLGLTFLDAAQQGEQMPFWPGGESSPPGHGKNSPARLRSVQAAAVVALLGK